MRLDFERQTSAREHRRSVAAINSRLKQSVLRILCQRGQKLHALLNRRHDSLVYKSAPHSRNVFLHASSSSSCFLFVPREAATTAVSRLLYVACTVSISRGVVAILDLGECFPGSQHTPEHSQRWVREGAPPRLGSPEGITAKFLKF